MCVHCKTKMLLQQPTHVHTALEAPEKCTSHAIDMVLCRSPAHMITLIRTTVVELCARETFCCIPQAHTRVKFGPDTFFRLPSLYTYLSCIYMAHHPALRHVTLPWPLIHHVLGRYSSVGRPTLSHPSSPFEPVCQLIGQLIL